jgi:hypothetical protein
VIVRLGWVLGIGGDDDVRGTGCGLGVEVDRLHISLHEEYGVSVRVDVH